MKKTTYYVLLLFITFFSLAAFAQSAEYLDSTAVQSPPEWLVGILDTIHSLPIVGPILTIVLQWLGVIVTVLTTMTVAIITCVRAIMTVAKWKQLFTVATACEAFLNGKTIYWLRYFSMFNAQKKPIPSGPTIELKV